MSDHDSPISIHGGGTLAKAIVSQENDHWSVPDGSILASWARRMVAFVIDVTIVYSVLNLSTGGMVANALNVRLWASSDFHYSVAFAAILLASRCIYPCICITPFETFAHQYILQTVGEEIDMPAILFLIIFFCS